MDLTGTIDDAAAAEASLHPLRQRILAELHEPGSASTLAADLGIARQKINYHLRILEQQGLVELLEERRRGNFTERIVQATAASYAISPAAMGPLQPDPARSPDRLSAQWLLALASRLVRDTGVLLAGSRRTHKPVSIFAMDGEIRFASAADRAAFARELTEAVTELTAKYHTDRTPETDSRGTLHRIVLALHPAVPDRATETDEETRPDAG
jgi:DNA-binding transcriptional ArsR family regulator